MSNKKMGRPRAYKTPQEMKVKIDAYFKEWSEQEKPFTMAMLISYLDICDDTFGEYSRGFYDDQKYENNQTFSETIKKARKFIEGCKLEAGLMGKANPTVTIFDLKNNHGYADKSEVTTKDVTPTVLKDDIPNGDKP